MLNETGRTLDAAYAEHKFDRKAEKENRRLYKNYAVVLIPKYADWPHYEELLAEVNDLRKAQEIADAYASHKRKAGIRGKLAIVDRDLGPIALY